MAGEGRVTARQVAELAGVSVSAVSRAFRRGAPLAAEKRERILGVARRLGYLSPAARSLAEAATGAVTLVAGDLANPFYPMTLEALAHELDLRGKQLILHAVPPGETVDRVLEQVLLHHSDAVIITSARMSSALARACRRRSMPVVLFNRVQPDPGMTAVTCDNYGGGRLVARRFVEAGRRRIAYVGGLPDTSTHIERSRGFRDMLGAAGVALAGEAAGGFAYEPALTAARDLMTRRPRPDAIFCANDIMALAAIDAARALGLDVPGDVAIVGFDDIPMAGWASYRLTTVRQPIRRMIADALELIELQTNDPAAQGAIRIAPVTLIERDSG